MQEAEQGNIRYHTYQRFDIHWHDGGPSIAMMYHLRRVSDLLCNWKSCLLCYMKDVVLHYSIFFKWNKLVRVRVRVQRDSSHSPCPLRASGAKPTLWSATGCDIYSHFHWSWVGSNPNATWGLLGVISSWSYPSSLLMLCRRWDSLAAAMPPCGSLLWPLAVWQEWWKAGNLLLWAFHKYGHGWIVSLILNILFQLLTSISKKG